jgi:hypothetical protein
MRSNLRGNLGERLHGHDDAEVGPTVPISTMSVIGLPVEPRSPPAWSASASTRIFARSASTSGITSSPYAVSGASALRRSATCSAGRSSVLLTGCPANMSFDPTRDFRLLRDREQELERARVEPLAAEVEQQPLRFERATLEAPRIAGEQLLDRAPLEHLHVLGEPAPGSRARPVGFLRHGGRDYRRCDNVNRAIRPISRLAACAAPTLR